MRKIAVFLGLGWAFCNHNALAKNPTFTPAAESVAKDLDVSTRNAISTGFYFNSLYPLTSPFVNGLGGEKEFRFQVPLGVGLELSYSMHPTWEFGANVGYEQFGTRVRTSGTSGIQEFQKVKLRQYPIMAFARYKFDNKNVSPEIEAGGGYSFGTVGVSSTNLGSKSVTESLSAYRLYGSGGLGLAWAENTSVHFSAGYSFIGYAEKNYSTTFVSVKGQSMSGIFVKSMIRMHF